MNDEPKTHEIDGVQYIEDGHPTAGEAIITPFLHEGLLFNGSPDGTVPTSIMNESDLSKFVKLRRLEP